MPFSPIRCLNSTSLFLKDDSDCFINSIWLLLKTDDISVLGGWILFVFSKFQKNILSHMCQQIDY